MHVCVDTFRHPYIELDSIEQWPTVHLDQLTAEETTQTAALVEKHLPDWTSDCILFSPAYSSKLGPLLTFGKEYSIAGQKYLYMLQVEACYLGGGPAVMKKQGIAPSFASDRIYYKSRIVPVEAIEISDKRIVSFQSSTLKEAIEHRHVKAERDHYWNAASFIFDQMDFTALNHRFSTAFSFGAPCAFETIFVPFIIEHTTLCVNLIAPGSSIREEIIKQFAAIWDSILNGTDPSLLAAEVKEFWQSYYASFQYQRTKSLSGNPHWYFSNYPGISNV